MKIGSSRQFDLFKKLGSGSSPSGIKAHDPMLDSATI
jgi:hypothetical protein